MLNCQKIHSLISQYATGELVDSVREEVGEHLQQCNDCRQELDTELELLTSLGNLPLVPCPDQVTENILEVIQNEEDRQSSNSQNWVWGISTLMAAVLALIILLPQSELGSNAENQNSNQTYTTLEIQSATSEARLALAKVASVINRNENNAFKQVFGQEIPGAVGGSLLHITKNLQGEV